MSGFKTGDRVEIGDSRERGTVISNHEGFVIVLLDSHPIYWRGQACKVHELRKLSLGDRASELITEVERKSALGEVE